MDNALMIGLQAQRVLQRRMEAVANNLANMATSGFKADAIIFESISDPAAHADAEPRDIRFVHEAGVMRDMSQGGVSRTGAPLDLAIEGEGFFAVQGPSGTLYTRDGDFTLAADGTLTTKDGKPVLGDGGAPLVLDLQGQEPVIGQDGAIRVGDSEAGRVGVYKFADPQNLEKVGDNLYDAKGRAAQAGEGRVVQGALESSNVRPVVELTRLIEISRAYESAARMVKGDDDLRKSAIERLGKAA
ncbi:MAG: flagellar basal-body rod protein FlgF [Hyphomonadaceae bacterium]